MVHCTYPLHGYYLSVCSCSIVATVEADCPGGVELVFGDLSSVPFGAHHPGTEEYLTKQQLLTQCVIALSVS